MNSNLIPITGALIAGLIGAAGAGCYTEMSYVCATANITLVEYFELPCGDWASMYPTIDWGGIMETKTDVNGVLVNVNQLNYCSGPAYYDDKCTMERKYVNATYYGAPTWYTVLGGSCP